MNQDRLIELVHECISDGKRVRTPVGQPFNSREHFQQWRNKARRTLRRIYGDDHVLVNDFEHATTFIFTSDTPEDVRHSERKRAIEDGNAVLLSAAHDLKELTPALAEEGEGIDPELWDQVSHLIQAERWEQAAASAATFLEDKVRTWAGLSPDHYGKDLMLDVFKPESIFPCGDTPGEQQGWQQLATGFVQALSNAVRHRIQERDDARTYAMGVVGTASLILTQLRHEHAARFHVK